MIAELRKISKIDLRCLSKLGVKLYEIENLGRKA